MCVFLGPGYFISIVTDSVERSMPDSQVQLGDDGIT
jgi:hypothetical protein